MNLNRQLARPTRKASVFDLVEETGFDMSIWMATAKPGKRKGNPRFAFEWAFVAEGRFVVLNLWYRDIHMLDGRISSQGNFRALAKPHMNEARVSKLAVRALMADDAVGVAFSTQLPLRLIISDGEGGEVQARDLDPASWSVKRYSAENGDFLLQREILPVPISRKRESRTILSTSLPVLRSDQIRANVLQRAKGRCEYCGATGFRTPNGALYLETHHIISIVDGGADHECNVIALCPNHHREAHFGFARSELRSQFEEVVVTKRSVLTATLRLAAQPGAKAIHLDFAP